MKYSNYIFIGSSALAGGLIYQAIKNLNTRYDYYQDTNNVFNYGMLLGLGIGTSLTYFKYSDQLLLKSSD